MTACRCTRPPVPLEALAIKGQPNKDMDLTTAVGASYPVEWVPIPEPDHDDDTDNRRDRVSGFTPNRVQAADRGAAIFSRQEGMWVGHGQKIYFDCTSGGKAGLGQVWEYAPGREQLTLIYESTERGDAREPRQRRDRAAHRRHPPPGGQQRRAVRPRRHPRRRDLRLREDGGERVGVLRRLLRPRSQDALPEPAGRPRQPRRSARPATRLSPTRSTARSRRATATTRRADVLAAASPTPPPGLRSQRSARRGAARSELVLLQHKRSANPHRSVGRTSLC